HIYMFSGLGTPNSSKGVPMVWGSYRYGINFLVIEYTSHIPFGFWTVSCKFLHVIQPLFKLVFIYVHQILKPHILHLCKILDMGTPSSSNPNDRHLQGIVGT